jgi:hypothetical protein
MKEFKSMSYEEVKACWDVLNERLHDASVTLEETGGEKWFRPQHNYEWGYYNAVKDCMHTFQMSCLDFKED